jgi:hypothetical protein
MDMQAGFSTQHRGEFLAVPTNPYLHLAEQRRRVFALISEFQKAVARPHGRTEAICVLKAILPCSGAYFALVESLVDRLTAGLTPAGAAPHRIEHRRILRGIHRTLDRCSTHDAKPEVSELAHVLDELVMYEAAIRFRSPGN